MSYQTQENNVDNTSSFMNAIDSEVNFQKGTGMVLGENGAPAHSLYNMSGETNTDLQGALVASFNGMLRNTSEERVYELMENVRQEAKTAGGTFEGEAIADLFVTWAHCRDRNEGKGERLVSYHMFMWLYEHFPQTTLDSFLTYFTVYGYWKDLSQVYLLAYNKSKSTKHQKWNTLKNRIVSAFVSQLRQDDEELTRNARSTNVSLCAKYVPKEGRSFDKKTKITKVIARQLFPELFVEDFRKAMKRFRSLYTRLNRHIDTVEIKECSGKWSEIDFNRVPGRALNIKRKAFLNVNKSDADLRHPDNVDRMKCRKNFQAHLQKAVTGEVKVKGKTMFIHELVEQIMNGRLRTDEEQTLIEAQWNAHVENFREKMTETNSSLGKGLCLVDVSGSMSGTPMNVAIAMGIFASSFAHEAFRDRFISFESEPHWIVLRYPKTHKEFMTNGYYKRVLESWDDSRAGGELSLREKVLVALYSPWGGTTNFIAAHQLILEACVKARLKPDELPEWFMILSDMQFDQAHQPCQTYSYSYEPKASYSYLKDTLNINFRPTNKWQTTHKMLGRAYHAAGMKSCGHPYTVPQQIYWNLRGDTVGFPVQSDTPNTQLVSGFSVALLKLFLSGEDMTSHVPQVKTTPTPWDTFRKAVDSSNYYSVRKACSDSREHGLRSYRFVEPEQDASSE